MSKGIEYKTINGILYTYDYNNKTITHYEEYTCENGFVFRMAIIDFMI